MIKEKHFKSSYGFDISPKIARFINEEGIKKENIISVNIWFDNYTDQTNACIIYIKTKA